MPFLPCTLTHYHSPYTASGQPYGGHNIAASRHFPMGTVLLIRYEGKTFRAVVEDRGRLGERTFDLPDRSFRRFIGRKGRVHAEFRRIGSRKVRIRERVRAARRHSRRYNHIRKQ